MANGDSIVFVNVSGDQAPARDSDEGPLRHFWVFNNKLKLLWKGEGQTGHFPYPFAVRRRRARRDRHRLRAVGPRRASSSGATTRNCRITPTASWSATSAGDPKAEPRAYASGSDEGFVMFDARASILKHVRVGHTQSPAVGKFRPDVPGLQYMTVNFWRNPGIVTLFDWDGNILEQEEPIHTGSAHAAGELARRRAGVRAAFGQHQGGRDDRRAAAAGR